MNFSKKILLQKCFNYLHTSTNIYKSIIYRNQGCRNHGCKCTPCLLHFQLCGCSAGADYGCNRCTKLLQQTELNVARGCVWGCSVFHPPVVRNSAKLLSIWRKVKRKALLMEFLARNYGGIVRK